MTNKTEDTPENKRRARYLKRFYGWMPADRLVKRLGFQSFGALSTWCGRRGIPTIFNRPGHLSTYQLADMLGVHSNTIAKWCKLELIPSYIGYKGSVAVRVLKQEEIEQWLMNPRPAWFLVKPEKVQDPKLLAILTNSQEYNHSYWEPLQDAAEALYMSESGLRKRVLKGHITSTKVLGRVWVHYPDAVRVLQGGHTA